MVEPRAVIERISQEISLVKESENYEKDAYLAYLENIIMEDIALNNSAYEIAMKTYNEFGTNQIAYSLIIDLFVMEIENGNKDAMYQAGNLKYYGIGCEANLEKAICLYKLSAGNGHEKAEERLGVCYHDKGDYENAYKVLSKCAFRGTLTSLYTLGDMYLNGHYVEKDPKEAFEIYKNCETKIFKENLDFEETYGPVAFRLGKCLLNGLGTIHDYSEALKYFHIAERYYFHMVKIGYDNLRKDLSEVIECENIARNKLFEETAEIIIPF